MTQTFVQDILQNTGERGNRDECEAIVFAWDDTERHDLLCSTGNSCPKTIDNSAPSAGDAGHGGLAAPIRQSNSRASLGGQMLPTLSGIGALAVPLFVCH